MTVILFWDIDGTLLNSGGAGRIALTEAVREMVGTPTNISTVEMAGMTDWSIATQILQNLNIPPSPAKIEELLMLYQRYLPASLSRTQGYVLSGVREILEVLHPRKDVLSVLLTGNSETGARAKLARYGLDKFFSLGAFGNGTGDRSELARQALELAQQAVGTVALDRCYLIGDTPHDVRCGRAIGAKAIAIASGPYSTLDLSACESWQVWEKFPQPQVFLNCIGLAS